MHDHVRFLQSDYTDLCSVYKHIDNEWYLGQYRLRLGADLVKTVVIFMFENDEFYQFLGGWGLLDLGNVEKTHRNV